ncbi:hypothetical protein F66182_6152 [Fusarium sp. NRRL 66182]|nr:hypothetical protein F66182_6152 [Fusarium sp. NRRL 66182]
MCRESIVIAQCAPHNPPVLSFNCGKLHMIAGDRLICDRADGTCVCFFGTCGTVDRDVTTSGIDLADIAKVRCAGCTAREDQTGDRRDSKEILESVLLQRPAIEKQSLEKHMADLKDLWRNKAACPYHIKTNSESPMNSPVTLDKDFALKGDHVSIVESIANDSTDVEPVSTEPDSVEEAPSEHAFNEPDSIQPDSAESVTTEPDAVVDEWTTDAAPPTDNAEDQVRKPSSDSAIENGLEYNVGIKSSRWASTKSPEPSTQESVVSEPRRVPTVKFTFDPNNAEKLREATQKLANLKTFLGVEVGA